ncbi:MULTISPECIES: hypothetical protein [Methylorubrum]|uniref:hypothetical protein n=1 Tax=Methylorubrum TaxID=2282523 RepID=UPI00209D6D21|nr:MULTISPECIES: hypothetical protein [Methylorubrum]MCP1551674.1 hypothetical protein [Methylorubrum zatmanii]MCP1556633.1 hypothetical protein [Methylorubrum extorquens]MCP1581752.1 hypothetical protein [Methylorubrum extorquens]
MYFIDAVYYTMSGIGFLSTICFFGMVFSIGEEENINQQFGYRNYFIILGLYALVAAPLAATINGGRGGDILFWLGCCCPAIVAIASQLSARHQAERAAEVAALAPPVTLVAPAPQTDFKVMGQPAYAPAPTSVVNDFDVPPQR